MRKTLHDSIVSVNRSFTFKVELSPADHSQIIAKFNSLTRLNNNTGCIEWQGGTDDHGYGNIMYQRKTWKAHRLSWSLNYGLIPDGLWVLHKCDNPKCINVKHLFLGTQKDNVDDMISKGRSIFQRYPEKKKQNRGERCGMAKLTESDVKTIRYMFNNKLISGNRLAEIYNVQRSNITHIIHGRSWIHIV